MVVVDLELRDRTAIVTGASRGIGLATARTLAAEGAAVLLVGRAEGALERGLAECRAAGGRTAALAADVTAPDAAERIVAECERRLGAVDVLVNNAGTSEVKPLEELTDADWQAQWELHAMAPMRLMRAAAPGMAERGWGRVVNVCSSSGRRPSLSYPAYSVTKAAQLSLSRTFADAYAGTGVHVNAIVPGPVETGLWLEQGGLADQTAAARGITREQALEGARAKIPRGRFGTEEEIAGVIAVLCSTVAANVVGAAWSVDGGSVAGIF